MTSFIKQHSIKNSYLTRLQLLVDFRHCYQHHTTIATAIELEEYLMGRCLGMEDLSNKSKSSR